MKIWRTFAYVEGQQNINAYDARQPFVSCVLPKFRILKMSQDMPMSKAGICNQCNNTAIAGCRVETDDESVILSTYSF